MVVNNSGIHQRNLYHQSIVGSVMVDINKDCLYDRAGILENGTNLVVPALLYREPLIISTIFNHNMSYNIPMIWRSSCCTPSSGSRTEVAKCIRRKCFELVELCVARCASCISIMFLLCTFSLLSFTMTRSEFSQILNNA